MISKRQWHREWSRGQWDGQWVPPALLSPAQMSTEGERQLSYPLNPLFLSLLVSRGSPTSSSSFPHSRLSMWDPEKVAFTSQLDRTIYHCQICLPAKFGGCDMHVARLCLDSESYKRGVLRDLPPTSKRELLPWLHCRLFTQCLSTGFKVEHDPKSVLGGLCHLWQEAKTSGLAFLRE